MSPRTRSNRAEKLAVQKLLSSGISVNTRGFPALPNELYLEILSHFLALPAAHDVWTGGKPDPYRQLTLYYLTQTCQSLRKFFLRYAWERIEVFGGMWTPVGRLAARAERDRRGLEMQELGDKMLVKEILRQLETVVLRNPHLRQYVSIVNLTIPRCSHKFLLPEVAQNLTLFPNLCSLQLVFRINYAFTQHRIFSEYRYPNVHTVSLSQYSPWKDILRACPKTRHLSFYKDVNDRFWHKRGPFDMECTGSIQQLGVLIGPPDNFSYIITAFRNLRDLSLDCDNLRLLSETPNDFPSLPLHTIRLRLDDWPRPFFRHVPATPDERERWIGLARRILAKCPQHDIVMAKKVIVVNYDKTVEVFSV